MTTSTSLICVRSRELSVSDIVPLPLVDERCWSDITLPNGLRALVLADARSANVAVTLGYHVGGKDDPHGRSGFAHLFEHLMFKGTKTTPAETIDRLTEDVGGLNNAFTTPDLTVYYEVVPANYLETMLWAEADRLASLVVDEANFHTERDVVISEYDQRVLADPYGKLDEYIEREFFAGHSYAQGVIGDPDSLRAATLTDVQQFHTTYYRPDNAVLVVIGDLDLETTRGWIQTHFGGIARPAAPIPRVALPQVRSLPTRGSYEAANVPLTAINFAYHLPSARHEDSPIIDMLEFILGVGRSSRLYRALVHDRHLAAQITIDSDLREQAGILQVRALLHEDAKRGEAETAIRAELTRICEELVSPEELFRTRNQLATLLVRHSESANNRSLSFVSDALLRGNPLALEADVAEYARTTAADIQRVAQGIFRDEPAIFEYRSIA